MKSDITSWIKFESSTATPSTSGMWRRYGDTVEVFAEQKNNVAFNEIEFLFEQGLELDLAKLAYGARRTLDLTFWEIDEPIEVPNFKTKWEKIKLLVTGKSLYRREIRRVQREYLYDSMPEPRLNPRFVFRQLKILIPVRPLYREEGQG